MLITETFTSLQGEGTRAGMPCFFIRLTGCNLRCRYCDTAYAFEGGRECSIDALISAAKDSGAVHISVTGGEPLMQTECIDLLAQLSRIPGKTVSLETNGSYNISAVPEGVTIVMDIKCPGSGFAETLYAGNIANLRPGDEVKFVISGEDDYRWALDTVNRYDLCKSCAAVFFVPAGGLLEPRLLAEWMIRDLPPVRFQMQLHKILQIQ